MFINDQSLKLIPFHVALNKNIGGFVILYTYLDIRLPVCMVKLGEHETDLVNMS